VDVDLQGPIHRAAFVQAGSLKGFMSKGLQLVLLLSQLLTVGCAVLVAFHPNILYASISLLFTFLGVAVMFVYSGADFLAGAQVIVYVGGVTILVLFAIMLTQWLYQLSLRDVGAKILVPTLIGVALLIVIWPGLSELGNHVLSSPPEKMAEFAALPKTKLMGQALLGNYVLAFEAITILLLGALVGAVWIARPK